MEFPESESLSSLERRFPKAAELVADDIRQRIIRGELKEGSFLPLESELQASYGLSRPTLREAFRILEAERLISVVRGSRTGARVHRPSAGSVSRYAGFVLQSQLTTMRDIYDARLAIEPFCAWRVARSSRRMASAEILQAEATRLAALIEHNEWIEFTVGIVGFHRLLVEQAENNTLLLLTTIIQDVTARHQVEMFNRETAEPDVQTKRAMSGIRSFHKLIGLIRVGDADAAAAHWQLHIVNANRRWVPRGAADKALLKVV